ncbi:MAG TPA: peptide deformylase [Bryobacteraceae bacterium]|nr:peptide deformylase [Bryobacteraceae bacterium]
MVLEIKKYGDPVLETPCEKVTNFGTPELQKLVDDMFETMYANKGVGLAAPQVGILQQLTVIDTSAGEEPNEKLVLINPEIVAKDGQQLGEEGCLSIPGFREDVRRAMTARVRAFDVAGNPIEVEGEELLARALQHEIDHLHGILFLKHLSPLKRDLIRRKISKLVKAGEW